MNITASSQAGYFPILPRAGFQQKNKSVLTKDLLSPECHCEVHNLTKLSKKASLFSDLTRSFDSLYAFPDIPRQHRSLRKHRQLGEHTFQFCSWCAGKKLWTDPRRALSPKQGAWAQSWCSLRGHYFPSPGHFLTTK